MVFTEKNMNEKPLKNYKVINGTTNHFDEYNNKNPLIFNGIYKLHIFCMSRIQLFSSNLKVVVFRVCKKSFMSSIRIFFSAK